MPIKLNDEDLLDVDVVVDVQLRDQIALDLSVDLIGNLVGGVVELVNGLLSGLIDGLLGGLFGPQQAEFAVVGVRRLNNGMVRARIMLLDNVQGGISLRLNIHLLDILGVDVDVFTDVLDFNGNAGEVIVVDIDLSALDNVSCDSNIVVSVDGFVLGLIDLNVNIEVQLDGLNDLLSNIVNLARVVVHC